MRIKFFIFIVIFIVFLLSLDLLPFFVLSKKKPLVKIDPKTGEVLFRLDKIGSANWARRNAKNTIPSLPPRIRKRGYKEYVRESPDCTNFVSYALFVGGWEMVGGKSKWRFWEWYSSNYWFRTPTDVENYFTRRYNGSNFAWKNAYGLAKFLQKRGRGKVIRIASTKHLFSLIKRKIISIGDIIQYGDKKGRKKHSMIVTAVRKRWCNKDEEFMNFLKKLFPGHSLKWYENMSKRGPICLSYHTKDKANRSLIAIWYIFSQKNTFYLQKLKTYYKYK